MGTIRIRASKAGSIGAKYNEVRTYNVTDSTEEEMCEQARRMAYADGLEHVLITHINGKQNKN